ncbi:hypothetical protein CBR_g51267 [Chara braunii]|uniref:Integrase catalytic domain-containing protein n=1 Tax=Chara braunii TaxID=69332 RepID=A0A388M879_CHABU|nr:hypothetical protein CBR_g51267 [Chara braunii]|eukprot:GBG90761.1 hypothetical protein CBR_g51267 [Chara braunii]
MSGTATIAGRGRSSNQPTPVESLFGTAAARGGRCATLLKWHFTTTASNSNLTEDNQTKEEIPEMIAQLIATCNGKQQELQHLARVIDNGSDQQDGTNRSFHTRIEDWEDRDTVTPGSRPSMTQPSTRQLEQRIDHVVATIGNLHTFAEPATISQHLRVLKADVRMLQQQPAGSNTRALPAPLTEDGVAVVDLRQYLAKIDATQRYDDIDVLLLYIRIQIRRATCSALSTVELLATTSAKTSWCASSSGRTFEGSRSPRSQSRTLDEHLKHLRTVLERLHMANSKANRAKCEANINMHNFPSFSKKALDLEAKIGHGHTPTTNGRKKALPPNWKVKGRLMFVDNDGSTIELEDDFQAGAGSEASSVEVSRGWNSRCLCPERYGLYEFVVMPFGLCNVPGTFQHAMNRIFHDYLDKFVIVYLDDILIFSRTVEEHVGHLDKVLSLLRQHKFKINGEKCEFGRARILYLGHEISAEGLKPDDAKVASIRDWPRPQSVTEMRSFLGMTGYYRNFVKKYSIIVAPLTDLTRLDTPWEWTDKCEAAFRHLKHALTHHEVLKLPDPNKPFVVTMDASQFGIGVVLAQQEGKKLRPEDCSKLVAAVLVAHNDEGCKAVRGDKPRTQAPLGLLKPLPIMERPGESLPMDFMDTLVTSKSGMRHIFVIVDRFSKYARLVAMPKTVKTEYVIRLFKENWVRDFGLPKSIISDRDVRFTSELWKAAAAEQGTQLQMTSGNHPEANGQAEQLNRTVQHLLRHYMKPNQLDWDEKLALITSLYSNTVHSATGVSPNSLLLTFKPRFPLDFLLPENQPSAAPGTLEFAYRYQHMMQQAVEQMHKAQAAMIESENKHRRPFTFQVGDRVWVKSSELGQEHGISRKLMPQYFGPWEVLDIVEGDPDGPLYVIRIPGHLRTYPVFHPPKLAPFKETDQFPSRRSMLPPTMDGEVDIDDIVDHTEMPVPRPTGR